MLGPNGAGKTTLIRMLTTLIPPTSGEATVAGDDVVRHPRRVRRKIGVIPQALTSDLDLTGWENIDIYGDFYGVPRAERRERGKRLLDLVGLTERANDLVATYSGGMRRRLEIARGLIHSPQVLFLDEPTIGLDPQSRRAVWDLLAEAARRDRTDHLAHHPLHGRGRNSSATGSRSSMTARSSRLDTPNGLKAMRQGRRPHRARSLGRRRQRVPLRCAPRPTSSEVIDDGDGRLTIAADDGAHAHPAPHRPRSRRSAPTSPRSASQRLSLEDVFIRFTGRTPARRAGAQRSASWSAPGCRSGAEPEANRNEDSGRSCAATCSSSCAIRSPWSPPS